MGHTFDMIILPMPWIGSYPFPPQRKNKIKKTLLVLGTERIF